MELYDNWLKELKDFKASIDKELADIQRCKEEMQKLKTQLITKFGDGYYLRDNHRIILSAPEIIIGDVMKDGTLNHTGTSTVIIRTNNIQQEGVGSANGPGAITNKATVIKNICADPGIDGRESVVSSLSRYSVQAEGITLQSETTAGTYAEVPAASRGEIRLQADERVTLAAQVPLTSRKKKIEDLLESKNKEKEQLEKAKIPNLNVLETNFRTYFKGIEAFQMDKNPDVNKQMADLFKMRRELMGNDIQAYIEHTSKQAEVNRQIKSLNKEKKVIELKEKHRRLKFKMGAAVNIMAENTNIWSVDQDMNVCESTGAGLSIIGKHVDITAVGNKDGIIDGSDFTVNTQNIHLSTANRKPTEHEGFIEMPTEGQVIINSKDITLESVNRTFQMPTNETPTGEDLGLRETELPIDGTIKLRSHIVSIDSRNVSGNANGEFNVQSKIVKIGALDKPNGEEAAKTAKDSLIEIKYNKAMITAPEDIALNSEKNLLLAGKETVEIQQEEGKAALQIASGKTTLANKSLVSMCKTNELKGDTTLENLTVKKKATIQDLEVEKHIKTPNSSEGTPGGAAPAAEEQVQLLLKITELEQQMQDIKQKEEEARKKEEEKLKKKEEEKEKQRKKEQAEAESERETTDGVEAPVAWANPAYIRENLPKDSALEDGIPAAIWDKPKG